MLKKPSNQRQEFIHNFKKSFEEAKKIHNDYE